MRMPAAMPVRQPAPQPVLSAGSALESAAERAGSAAVSAGPVPGVGAPAHAHGNVHGNAQTLPVALRHRFERHFSHDFSQVRLHADAEGAQFAAAQGADAVTRGRDIHFAAGRYRPQTLAGQQLIAHELAHVHQADTGQVSAHTLMRRLATPDATTPKPGAAAALPVAGPDAIPSGGTTVDKVGVVARDRAPALRLRATPSTAENNVIGELPFNTTVQVIKSFPGDWLFIATADGRLGYAAALYVKTNLPEPDAKLHRVEAGLPGFAISIAEKYYKDLADDWGQDLRFYVNVLAWVNHKNVPNTTAGWREVQFRADEFIWIPTPEFARSLRDVVNSGSRSHNLAEAVGIAGVLDRIGELWDDIRAAISMSKRYIVEAIGRHVEAALWGVLESIAMMLVIAAALLAVTTVLGGVVSGLVSGGAAAPAGAAAGFEIGVVLLQWLGLGMLVVWIAQSVVSVGGAFADFLGGVWNARGDKRQLDIAARLFAEAIGTLCGVLVEGLVMWAVSIGATQALGAMRGGRFGKAFNNSKTGEWLNERVRRVKAGETTVPTPKDVFARLVREVELVDAKNSPVGEFDGVDLKGKRFVENKSAAGMDKPNPRTGVPQQSASSWAAKQITGKTSKRIRALASATATRGKGGKAVPSLGEIQGIRHMHFVIDTASPALKAAVFAELATLRTAFPGWTFSAEFGITIVLPPVPGTGQPDDAQGDK